jgi:L-ascorbate metabolism protein UlaG (beta-lactamase superfamily)
MPSSYFYQIKYLYNPDLEIVKENWKGNPFYDFEFMNGLFKDRYPLEKLIKWSFDQNVLKKKKNSSYHVGLVENPDLFTNDKDVIVWLGHSSFFIRINGISIITDPCFGDLPYHKRLIQVPFRLKDIENIDYVLISHGHRDHLDENSIHSILDRCHRTEFLIPLLMGEILRDMGCVKVQEAAWYQKYKTYQDIEIIFLPAKHWHRRGYSDYNRVLWGSFLIRSGDISIYFAGDSAFGPHFKEIRKLMGKINICLMPVGAYKPAYLRQSSHMNPHESFHAFKEMGGEVFVPMHYGTYQLAGEPMSEPELALKTLQISSKGSKAIKILQVGEELLL